MIWYLILKERKCLAFLKTHFFTSRWTVSWGILHVTLIENYQIKWYKKIIMNNCNTLSLLIKASHLQPSHTKLSTVWFVSLLVRLICFMLSCCQMSYIYETISQLVFCIVILDWNTGMLTMKTFMPIRLRIWHTIHILHRRCLTGYML